MIDAAIKSYIRNSTAKLVVMSRLYYYPQGSVMVQAFSQMKSGSQFPGQPTRNETGHARRMRRARRALLLIAVCSACFMEAFPHRRQEGRRQFRCVVFAGQG